MKGRIVTNQQAENLQGIFFDSNTFFDFIQDINDVYFLLLSEQDEADIAKTDYSYLLDIPLSPFEPKPTPFPPFES